MDKQEIQESMTSIDPNKAINFIIENAQIGRAHV